MSNPLTPQTLAWLRQSAALDHSAYSQALLHLLERVESLEQRPIPGTVKLATPTPDAAPVATDAELKELCWGIAGESYGFSHTAIRAVYDLGRQHGAAAAQPAPVAAPAGGLVERVAWSIAKFAKPTARAAILEVVAWLREIGNNGFADDLQQEVDR